MSAIQKHTQWMRHLQDQGWSHGETHDAAKKKHPQMKPWELLSEQEQANFLTTGDHDYSAGTAEQSESDPPASDEANEPTADVLDQPAPEPDHNG